MLLLFSELDDFSAAHLYSQKRLQMTDLALNFISIILFG